MDTMTKSIESKSAGIVVMVFGNLGLMNRYRNATNAFSVPKTECEARRRVHGLG